MSEARSRVHRLAAAAALGLALGPAAARAQVAGQGVVVAALTPGRDGRGEVHVELRDAALRAEVLGDLKPGRFRALVKAGVGRVEQVSALDAEGGHVVLAFDQSGSFRPFLNDALALASKYLSASPPTMATTVLSFGTTLGDPQDAPSPAEAQRLLTAVGLSRTQLQTRLKSSIRDASLLSARHLPMPRGSRQVVVFTDAGEESSVYTIEQVIAAARESGVRVHTVVFGGALQAGPTLAQRRDGMKRLSEETGGHSIEVRDRLSSTPAIEAAARSVGSLVRLSLSYCDVPATPALRDDQVQVEVLRGGSVAATSPWAGFSQQAGGAASRPCQAAPAASAPAPVASTPAPVDRAPPSAHVSPLVLLGALGGAGLLAVILAVLLRGRRQAAPPAPPPPAPPPPLAPPLPAAPAQVDPLAATFVSSSGLMPLAGERWQLRVLRSPAGAGHAVPLSRRTFTIGASEGNDLRFDVPELSGRHVVLDRTPQGEWTATDQGSTNGSFVDGQRLERGRPTPLKPGQSLQLSTKIELRIEPG